MIVHRGGSMARSEETYKLTLLVSGRFRINTQVNLHTHTHPKKSLKVFLLT